MSWNFFILSDFYSLSDPLSCHSGITLFKLEIMLRQTCRRYVLSDESDFMAQKSWLAETIEKYPGCFLFFNHKFHCELNSIEMVWGWIKSYHRNNYTYKDLKYGLNTTLDEKIAIAFVRRVFNHCLLFMAGCRVGLTGAVIEYAVKKYRNHIRLSACINPANLESQYTFDGILSCLYNFHAQFYFLFLFESL